MAEKIKGSPEVLAQLGVGQQRKGRRWLTRFLMFAVVCGLAAGVWVWRAQARENKGPTWITEAVEKGDLRETVTATGTLSPLDLVEVGAQVTGRVTKVHVDVNDPVKLDQVLVELDIEQLQARVEESQAQLRSAQAAYNNAKAGIREAEAKANRTRELHKRGLSSDQDLESAEAALDRAKASVSSASAQITVAQASLKSAQTDKSRAIIRSPIDGIVLARSVEVGQTVTSGLQTPILFTLARDLTRMQLSVDVDEADVGKVKEKQRATFVVDAYPKRVFNSEVVLLSHLPKPETTVITYEALLTVDNSDRLLRPGMTATATIITSEKEDVLSVPNAALRFRPPREEPQTARRSGLPLPGMRGRRRRATRAKPSSSSDVVKSQANRSKDAVWVLAQGKPRRVPVQVGASDGRRTEIKGEGLKPGMQVITDFTEAEE